MSHYKALYCFKQGRYDLVLKLCKDIVEEDTPSDISTFDSNYPLRMYIKPTFCSISLELFNSEFQSLIGMIVLIKTPSLWTDIDHELLYIIM